LGLAATGVGGGPVAAGHERELVERPPFLLEISDTESPEASCRIGTPGADVPSKNWFSPLWPSVR
jgi:hypothetical protein